MPILSLIFADAETKVQCASVAARLNSSASDLPEIALRIADGWRGDSATPLGKLQQRRWAMQKLAKRQAIPERWDALLCAASEGRGKGVGSALLPSVSLA